MQMPGWMQYLVNHKYWHEALVSVFLLAATWLAAQIYLLLVDKLFHKWASRTPTKLDDKVWETVRRPGYLMIFLVGLYGVVHRYHFALRDFIDGILFVIAVFLVVYTVIKILEDVLDWYVQRPGQAPEVEQGKSQLALVADKFAKIFLVAIGIIIVLDRFRIDIKSILVTLGVGSLAIGLALQDTLANMFGGFTILLDRPFRVGDRIQLQTGELGDVQYIGLRSTTILLPDHNLLVIPNAILVKNMVTNYSYPDSRARVVIEVGISYQNDVDEAKRLMLEAAQENPDVLGSPEPSAILDSFSESALKVTLTSHIKSFKDASTVKDRLNTVILAKFRIAGIEVAFPIQTVRLEKAASD